MPTSILFHRMGVLFYLAGIVGAFGQLTPYQTMVQAFQTEQQTLAQEQQALVASGATSAQLNAWRQQNAAAFALQQQRAKVMASASALTLLPTNRQAQIPAGASSTLAAYLTTQATLANARAQIHNQNISASTSGTATQNSSSTQSANDALLQRQNQLAAILADQEAQKAITPPPPVVFPPNASSQLQAFLTTRDQLMRSEIQLHNQNLTNTPAVRLAARLQWEQTNAPLFIQLRQLEQTLAQSIQTQAQGGTSE